LSYALAMKPPPFSPRFLRQPFRHSLMLIFAFSMLSHSATPAASFQADASFDSRFAAADSFNIDYAATFS